MGAPTPCIQAFEAYPCGATMAKKNPKAKKREQRAFTDGFKQEAVQMLVDGHSANSVSKRRPWGLRRPWVQARGETSCAADAH